MKARLRRRLVNPNDISASQGKTAFDAGLQHAIVTGDFEPCKLLLQSGADLDIEQDSGFTDALSVSEVILSRQRPSDIQKMSELIPNIDIPSLWNFSHLHKVVVGILPLNLPSEISNLSHDSHIDCVDIQNRTALHWAALRGDYEAVQVLLAAGAKQHMINMQGASALHLAIFAGSLDCISILIAAGADVHLRTNRGDNPMMIAAWTSDNSAIIRALISAGADPMSRNRARVTPLQYAAKLNRAENVKAFIELGADVNASDMDGDTPLFMALYYGSTEAMEVLLQQRIDFSHQNKYGWTVLHALALYGTADTLIKIEPHISDVSIAVRDIKGRTALEALDDQPLCNADFRAKFQALIERLDEAGMTDSDSGDSDDSFNSAIETQA
ncbi:MAG: hypothetical protein M1822_004393 [Bathelium mastoideum]|nr:MAG: hypothetical protein M1822_004393 [Bathelium mastoideum]